MPITATRGAGYRFPHPAVQAYAFAAHPKALRAPQGAGKNQRDGKIIGAVGCSGGTGAQDGQTCKAGVDTLK
jgi:glc operon protein GlcG